MIMKNKVEFLKSWDNLAKELGKLSRSEVIARKIFLIDEYERKCKKKGK